VSVDFTVTIADNDYSVPVRISPDNRTTGATRYQWTFEGGEPATSETFQPGMVTYHTAGTYTIRLEAWNDDERKTKDYTLLLDSALTVGFNMDIAVNNISPVQVMVSNTGIGAISWNWVFEGGNPPSSNQSAPVPVTFTQSGEHTIVLNVSNGREQLSLSKTVTVLPSMSTGFEVTPSFDDLDMEAPWTGTLQNTTVSGLSYIWTTTEGIISDPHVENPQISFAIPGTYTIVLEAQNGKETQTVEQTVTILTNSGLYTETNIRLGGTTAHTTIGCFYSCPLRKVITQNDMTSSPPVDLVFFGMGPLFPYCRFLSPDIAGTLVFDEIPNATKTYIVNKQVTPIFTPSDFDAMTTDEPLRALNIRSMDSGTESFDVQPPYVVLFETTSGRKGAIKIKGFVSEGYDSYILADIKMQKE
jgi:PKD repeat protein